MLVSKIKPCMCKSNTHRLCRWIVNLRIAPYKSHKQAGSPIGITLSTVTIIPAISVATTGWRATFPGVTWDLNLLLVSLLEVFLIY